MQVRVQEVGWARLSTDLLIDTTPKFEFLSSGEMHIQAGNALALNARTEQRGGRRSYLSPLLGEAN